MKMTKQVIKMVETVNEYCIDNHIKDTADPLFSNMCYLLIKAGCYHGFNFYTLDRKLSGGKNERFDHLEIYTR